MALVLSVFEMKRTRSSCVELSRMLHDDESEVLGCWSSGDTYHAVPLRYMEVLHRLAV